MDKSRHDKIRLLFLNPWAERYGAEKALYLIVKYLNRELFEPVVVLPREGPLWDMLKDLGVTLFKVPLKPWFDFNDSTSEVLRWLSDLPQRTRVVADIINALDIQIVHSNVSQILEGALAAKLADRPHILSVRGDLFALGWVQSFLPPVIVFQMLSSLSSAIVPVSSSIASVVRPFVESDKLLTIHDGVATDGDRPRPSSPRPERITSHGPLSKGPRIVSIGRVTLEKGYDLLLDAAALVIRECPEARFSVYGPTQDTYFFQRLSDQANRLELGEALRFNGHTDNVEEKLAEADLLVLPSRTEGLALVVLEAMQAGKPVVSTRCGGPEDIVVDGETGYLVPLDDPPALAEAILKLVRDPDEALRMGRMGRERVRAHFDARHTAEKHEALYHEVLRESPPAGQAASGDAAAIEAVFQTLENYFGELHDVLEEFPHLRRFEVRVKKTLAYRGYKAAKGLIRPFLKEGK